MEALSPPLMEGGGPKAGSPRRPPDPHCACCWPRGMFDSAAALLGEIEDLCRAQESSTIVNALNPPKPWNGGAEQRDQHQQQQEQQQGDSSCLDVVRDLVSEAVELLVDVLRIFGPERIVLSFNGGKDAVAILHLYRAALVKYTRFQQQQQQQEQQGSDRQQTVSPRCAAGLLPRPRAVYFHAGAQEFPEVENFVRRTAEEFSVSLETYYCDWASGLRSFVSRHPQTPVAFVLGTRRSDPQGAREKLEFLQPSSRWLPPFMRVQPLLHFGYGHVWTFLRHLRLPYCSLYDQGYSSIGTMANTLPNPLLAASDGGRPLPAYELQFWDREREGRQNLRRNLADSGAAAQLTTE